MSAAAADIAVRIWGEARGERQHAGVIRVLVAGEHAGAIQLGADGGWTAEAGGPDPPEPTSHATAQEALDAVARSSWARKLGARSASPVYWFCKAVTWAYTGAGKRTQADIPGRSGRRARPHLPDLAPHGYADAGKSPNRWCRAP